MITLRSSLDDRERLMAMRPAMLAKAKNGQWSNYHRTLIGAVWLRLTCDGNPPIFNAPAYTSLS